MCAVLSSVCATTVNNSGVYVYYLKGIVSVCFRCPDRTVGFSGTRLYLCIYVYWEAGVWSRSLSFEGDSDSGPYLFYLDVSVVLLQCM